MAKILNYEASNGQSMENEMDESCTTRGGGGGEREREKYAHDILV
jgi:hypothetical protein